MAYDSNMKIFGNSSTPHRRNHRTDLKSLLLDSAKHEIGLKNKLSKKPKILKDKQPLPCGFEYPGKAVPFKLSDYRRRLIIK